MKGKYTELECDPLNISDVKIIGVRGLKYNELPKPIAKTGAAVWQHRDSATLIIRDGYGTVFKLREGGIYKRDCIVNCIFVIGEMSGRMKQLEASQKIHLEQCRKNARALIHTNDTSETRDITKVALVRKFKIGDYVKCCTHVAAEGKIIGFTMCKTALIHSTNGNCAEAPINKLEHAEPPDKKQMCEGYIREEESESELPQWWTPRTHVEGN